jgi:hypothetical protein
MHHKICYFLCHYNLTKSGEQGGGRNPTSVTPLNDQAESLGTKEMISLLMVPHL